MQLHTVQPLHPTRKKRRVGRGGKRGTYSGRGIKGQRARSGARIRPEIRDLIKKIPKLRGIGFPRPRKPKPQVINVGTLEARFSSGAHVTPKTLHAAGLLERSSGRMSGVKLLGVGNISKKFLVASCQVSKTAREKIEKAGGVIVTKQ